MNNKNEIKKRIAEEEDYVYNPRMGNSLDKMMENYPNGIDDAKIAKVLMLTKEQVQKHWESAIVKLRGYLGVDLDE